LLQNNNPATGMTENTKMVHKKNDSGSAGIYQARAVIGRVPDGYRIFKELERTKDRLGTE